MNFFNRKGSLLTFKGLFILLVRWNNINRIEINAYTVRYTYKMRGEKKLMMVILPVDV